MKNVKNFKIIGPCALLFLLLGFFAPMAIADEGMPEIVSCFYAESDEGEGYWRCSIGGGCEWREDKSSRTETMRDCIVNPGQQNQ